MLREPTVVVLGAGSSVDFGLPTGAALAQNLETRLHFEFEYGSQLRIGDHRIYDELSHRSREEIELLFPAARRVSDYVGRFRSIDDCLYTHSDDHSMVSVGKMGIASVISDAERASFIYKCGTPGNQGLEERRNISGTWMHSFLHGLCTGFKASQMESVLSNLTIINFNYDRCFEAVLFYGLQSTFGRSPQDVAAAMVEHLRIYRPYGSLGPLDIPSRPGIPLGAPNTPISTLSDGVKIYTEELGERDDLSDMRERLSAASNIVFLGFAFHEQNMALLDIGEAGTNRHRTVYGTAFHEPEPKRQAIGANIFRRFGTTNASIHLGTPEQTCSTFLADWAIAFMT